MTQVVLYVQDALRAVNCSTYGYGRETTPNLSELADDGVRFTGVTPATWTKSAAASILTGCRPFVHQTITQEGPFTGFPHSLPEVLPEDVTKVGVVSNGYLSSDYGFDRGFDEYIEVYESGENWSAPPAAVTEQVLARLADFGPDEDLFLLIWTIGPHLPYDSGETRWGSASVGRTRGVKRHVKQRGRQAIVDRYDDQIRENDEHLGTLVAELKRAGRYEDACLVVAGDHGEGFGEGVASIGARSYGHGAVVPYQELIEVPLVVKPPRGVAPGPDDELASLVDVFPTVCGVLGVETPEPTQGCDVLSRGSEREYCVVQTPGLNDQGDVFQAVRSKRWNFIKVENRYRWRSGIPSGIRPFAKKYVRTRFLLGEILLPIEGGTEVKRDASADHPEDAAEARERLTSAETGDAAMGADVDGSTAELSEATYRNLEELGYLG